MTLNFGAFPIHKEAELPEKATQLAACYDLKLYLDKQVAGFNKLNEKIALPVERDDEGLFIMIEPGHRLLMPTGFIFDIPESHSIRLHPRSGLSLKKGISLANCEGIIDEDYVKQTYALLTNNSEVSYKAKHKERLCQMEIVKDLQSEMVLIDEAPEPRSDRNGGIGSTGTK